VNLASRGEGGKLSQSPSRDSWQQYRRSKVVLSLSSQTLHNNNFVTASLAGLWTIANDQGPRSTVRRKKLVEIRTPYLIKSICNTSDNGYTGVWGTERTEARGKAANL
jgi:hypothetical protein